MRLNQIRDLIAVADAGSLRAAASRIGLSQPAISKSLAQLERELEVQLLSRSSRGAVLTAAGRAVAMRARVIQSELAKVKDDLTALHGGTGGAVAFGIGPAASVPLVPDAMARFMAERPLARIRIQEGTRNFLLPLVRDETLDFAIAERAEGSLEPGIRFQPLLQPELVITAAPHHPLASAKSLDELVDASWLAVYPLGAGGLIERAFHLAGLPPPNIRVHCESHAVALSLIARGNLLGVVLRRLTEEPAARQFLRRVPIRNKIPRPRMGIFMRSDAPLSPTAALMVRALTGAARALAR
jgi:DNA-binding transcriptional LysR family regulator